MSDDFDQYHQGDLAFTRKSPYGTLIEATYSGATSFMRRRYTRNLEAVDVAVMGIPYDLATSNRPGARFGPRGVRTASTQLSWARVWPWDFDPFDRLHVIDYGDCLFDPGVPDKVPEQIQQSVALLLRHNVIPLCIGGDHFVTYPILKAMHDQYGPVSLIHFDAHCDSWADDAGRIDHGTMFYHAAKQGLVDPARSVQVGMRTHNKYDQGFHVLDALWLHEHGAGKASADIKRIVGERPCYLTFDIDFLDPSCAPGTGTPVCGGFDTITAIKLLTSLAGIKLLGCDLVEVAPDYDHAEITSLAGATLAAHMICLLAYGREDVV